MRPVAVKKRRSALSDDDHPLTSEIGLVRDLIRSAVPSATESIKWNSPSFATSEHFATFFLRAKAGFQVVLHLGVKSRPDVRIREEIKDPSGLLEWRGADRAIVTFLDEKDIEAKRDAFSKILKQWVRYL